MSTTGVPALAGGDLAALVEQSSEMLADIKSLLNVASLLAEVQAIRRELDLYKLQVPCELSSRFSAIEGRLATIEKELGIE